MIYNFEKELKLFSSSNNGMFKDEPIFNVIHYEHYLNCFRKIPEKWRSSFIKKFVNSNEQKYQTLVEMEVISLFPEMLIDIKKINNKTPDFVIKSKREIIVDVYAAMHFIKSNKVGFDPCGQAIFVGGVTHHLEMALKEKFTKYSGHPLLVILNKNFSFVDFDQIPFVDLTSYDGHENLSAFIVYESTQINSKVEYRFHLVPYHFAKYPLTKEEIELIKSAFSKSL